MKDKSRFTLLTVMTEKYFHESERKAISTYIKSVACVNRQLHFHSDAEITNEMLEMAYSCPVELIAHGLPHRVLKAHESDSQLP